jgi:hypothetical protein
VAATPHLPRTALLTCAILLAAPLSAADDTVIAPRNPTPATPTAPATPGGTPSQQQQASLAALAARAAGLAPATVPADKLSGDPWTAWVRDVAASADLATQLLIPAGYPNSSPKAVPLVRQRVARALGETKDRRALNNLVSAAVYDPDPGVRLLAAAALPKLEEPIALRKLTDLAIARDHQKYPWPVRKSACAALRTYGDKEIMERILRELSYELAGGNVLDPKNRPRGVASGLGTENPLMLREDAPDLKLAEYDLYPVLAALKEITGHSFAERDKDLREWQKWWREKEATFQFPK